MKVSASSQITSTSPQITSISPSRARYNQVITIRGTAFGANRGTSRVIFQGGNEPRSSQYVSWSDTQIRVRVPTGARTGNVQVVTANGRASARLTITSPWVSSISPQTGRTHTVVTISGGNFGSSRGSSTVRIGSVVVSSTSFVAWSNRRILFRIPRNTPPGNLIVRTSEGTSNAIRLQTTSPYLTSISPTRIKTGDRLTLTGGNFGNRRGTGYILFASNVRPSAADYVSWSNSRIVVKVPARAQSGNVQVATSNGTSGTKLLQIESRSPQISSVSPRRVQYNQVVTVTGSNFGSSRGSSTARIGSVAIPSSSLASWSNTRIRFRVPTNVRSGNLVVRTSAGTSNAIRLEITSPYLASVSPSRVNIGDRLTLTGANFRSSRGSGYVLFTPNVRPSFGDYVTWSDSRIVVKVPAGAQSGEVKVVVTGSQSSGTKRIIVEGDVVESLPSRGLFGYSPPTITKNPKSVKFGFGGASRDLACYFSVKEISDGEIDIFLNEQSYAYIPASEDWTGWYLILDRTDLRTGTNTIEFRNIFNQNRTSSFARWQLKDVWVGEPPSAKPVAGMQFLSKLSDGLVSGLGDPFPTPFNAEVTIPFALAEAGPVRLAVYNLMGQQVRV
ncbi:MAG: IPT/TIG domain-containing protein, partial [Gemmatimonadota bacterium]|nr:IPT/TIG domain-containing protein [Gemmatimonadota bacterium]